MGFLDRLFGKKQAVVARTAVPDSGPTLDLASLLRSSSSDPAARAGAIVFLGRASEWYMVSERDRGDVPMAMVAPEGVLEVLAFSTPQAAIVQAQTMSMGEGSTRPVLCASPRDALVLFERIGATQIRFDIYQHDLVVTVSDIRKAVA